MTLLLSFLLLLPWACREHAAGEQRLRLENAWRLQIWGEGYGYEHARAMHSQRATAWALAATVFDVPQPGEPPGQFLPKRKPAPAQPVPVQPPAPVIVPVPVAPAAADPARGWIEAAIATAGAVLATGAAGFVQWLARRKR